MTTTAVIVQARLGSERFPRKVLAPLTLNGTTAPVLAHVLMAVRGVKCADQLLLVTPEDHGELWDIADECEFYTLTGSENDVLDRYYRAAKVVQADLIFRVTADCPCFNPEIADELMDIFLRKKADYGSNVMPRSYPQGWDCELMTFDALEVAWLKSQSDYEREHVTPWLQTMPGIRRVNLRQKVNDSRFNLCIDYPEDIARVEKLTAERTFKRARAQ
jgi:spore coat polysaccharide biosynthesis protein SpsF (cytidylyltransferase family)